ncbi:hypothetical protein CH063_02230 [Colletotrichum higginsianum]|uniref:ABC transporter domain-containing protein n=1 Tax=Colletotrichum higginsianum (strain IMI 349063) TaxID=759273 RepID=H1VI38_COLHI|nr:hypothetical protein CH063_02230 [Colletotrichum higginsianum]
MARDGQTVGICGASGSGKSTVLLALLGLLHIEKGFVLVGDKDIRILNDCELHASIGVVPQEPLFLPGRTVRDHVDTMHQATDEQIKDKLRQVVAQDCTLG